MNTEPPARYNRDMRNDTETDLSEAQRRDLRLIAGFMVPASEEYGVPGADDAAIFADIVRSLGRDRAASATR